VPEAWTTVPLLVAVALLALYLRGVAVAWRRAGAWRVAGRLEVATFVAGMGSLIAASTPALHEAAEETVAAHMAQHLLLMVVAPPLLVLARPLPALAFALPVSWRRPVGGPVGRLGRLALRPAGVVTAAVLSAVAFWVWHAPFAYDAAVRHESLHALEHVTLLATSLLLWWTIAQAGRGGTRETILAMASAMLSGIQGSALGLLMLVSSSAWYGAYGAGPEAIENQQLAGALMWGGTGGVYVLAVATLLWQLLVRAEATAA
jgi:putative membrane protein